MVAIQKDADAEAVVGGSSRRNWRRGASSRAISSRSPISRSAPMRGAGSASKASPSRNCHISSAGSRDFSDAAGICPIHRAADVVNAEQFNARSAAARMGAGADADGAADLDAGVRALDLDETRAIRRAGIGRRRALQRELSCPEVAACPDFGWPDCSASAMRSRQHPASDHEERFSHPAFYRAAPVEATGTNLMPTDLAAAPDHFAGPAGPRVARKRQPQFGRQCVGILDRDLGAGDGHVLHHAGPRREAALERDPSGLAQRFARLALLGVQGHVSHSPGQSSPTPSGFKKRCEKRCRFRRPAPRPRAANRPQKAPFSAACPPGQSPLYVRAVAALIRLTVGGQPGASRA